jgi:hypothetical protein
MSEEDLNKQTIIHPELHKFPTEHIKYFFGPGKGMEKIAKTFGPIPKQDLTCFIRTISVYTSCEIDNAKFKIQLYNVNENGSPSNLIKGACIIANAKFGKDYTVIDVNHLDIKYPRKGFCVAIEWLRLKRNERFYAYKYRGKGERLLGMNYEPTIAAYPSEHCDTWVFDGENWVQRENSKSILSDYDGKFRSLEIKMELGSRI